MVAQENTYGAFKACVCDGKNILAPSVMLTKHGDLLLWHDIESAQQYVNGGKGPADIRVLTRSEILDLTIDANFDGHQYPSTAKFMFLDQLLDEFLLPNGSGFRIFLDIKNSDWPIMMSEYNTPAAIVLWLEEYRVGKYVAALTNTGQQKFYSMPEFYSNLFLNSSNPYVMFRIMELCAGDPVRSIPTTQCVFDYNDRGMSLCAGREYMASLRSYDYETIYNNQYITTSPGFLDTVDASKYKVILYGVPTIEQAAEYGADMFLG